MLGDGITDMLGAYERCIAAGDEDVAQLLINIGLQPDLASEPCIGIYTFYYNLLIQECKDIIPMFDEVSKGLLEQSQSIRTMLGKQQLEQFVPVVIPEGEFVMRAAKDAGIRCRNAMIGLQSDIRELRYAGLPFQTVIQSAVRIFKDYDDNASMMCKTSTFLLNLIALLVRDIAFIKIYRSTNYLERTLSMTTNQPYMIMIREAGPDSMLGGTNYTLGADITLMGNACGRFRDATAVLNQEHPDGIPLDFAHTCRRRTFNLYHALIIIECECLIFHLDKATLGLLELTQYIHSILNRPQTEQFSPTVIPNGEAIVMAVKDASERCQHAMMKLQINIRRLRPYPHLPLETVMQSAVEIFKKYEDVAYWNCKVLTSMLDFTAEIASDVVDIKRFRREEQLKSELFAATETVTLD